MVRSDSALACGIALALSACDVAPRGEALIVVDTDMPVPKIVDHVRVDVYSADGARWFVSRDIPAADPAQWPLSFSVYTDDTDVGASALVRLRGYRSGYVQDYLGASVISLPPIGSWTPQNFNRCCDATCVSLCPQYWQPTATCSHPPCVEGGPTPSTEPQPLVTIDRIVRVDLVPGVRGKVVVTLAGACAGTPAVLPDPTRDNPSPDDIQSCVDTERTLAPVASVTLDPDLELPKASSLLGHFEDPFQIDCAKTPRVESGVFDAEVCVRGGVMILGDTSGVATLAALPRIAAVPSFLMDKYEFSVGRLRRAISKGYVANNVYFNDGPSNDQSLGLGVTACTMYSDPKWHTVDRDAEAVNCNFLSEARAICAFYGGDVPTEAQWEYAASVAGRPSKDFVTFPTARPQCSDVAFSRSTKLGVGDCLASGFGVARVDYGATGDVADPNDDPTMGDLINMTGNVSETVRDAATSMYANCWLASPIASPSCITKSSALGVVRGGSWSTQVDITSAAYRHGVYAEVANDDVGFRCVR